jgi:hypothetical protein
LQPQIQQTDRLGIPRRVGSAHGPIDHVEMRIPVGLSPATQRRVGIQICLLERPIFFQPNQVLEIDVIQIELKVALVVVEVIVAIGR